MTTQPRLSPVARSSAPPDLEQAEQRVGRSGSLRLFDERMGDQIGGRRPIALVAVQRQSDKVVERRREMTVAEDGIPLNAIFLRIVCTCDEREGCGRRLTEDSLVTRGKVGMSQ